MRQPRQPFSFEWHSVIHMLPKQEMIMASQAATPTAIAEPESDWNEARIESAMARLQEMHAQVRTNNDLMRAIIDTKQAAPSP